MRSRLVNYKQALDHPTRPQACGYYEWALKLMTHCNKGKARKATRATSPIDKDLFINPWLLEICQNRRNTRRSGPFFQVSHTFATTNLTEALVGDKEGPHSLHAAEACVKNPMFYSAKAMRAFDWLARELLQEQMEIYCTINQRVRLGVVLANKHDTPPSCVYVLSCISLNYKV